MQELAELKQNVRSIIKKLTPNSEPRASIESSKHTIQYAHSLVNQTKGIQTNRCRSQLRSE